MLQSKLTTLLLNSLIHYDEALRNGHPCDTLVFSTEPGFQDNFECGKNALDHLEAAIPRRSKAMPSWAPRRIGRFELQSVLGAGAFAVVYLALDPLLSRLVALKVPRPHALVQPELRRQFVVEAQAAAKLDHPHIVPVYEAGQDGDLPYIACAWCDGPTLASWLSDRTTPLKPELAAKIIRQIADALRCSHEHGILHRDIKPGNVLLFPQSSDSNDEFPFVPRLGDFGLAKLLASSELDVMTSQLVGTPLYMAPELLNGPNQPAKAAADIYALGSVLYCLIVGQPPFVAATTAETFRLIAECDPVPPYNINRGIGRDLSLICLKCLEKKLQHRYESAEQLVNDLDRFLAGKPVLARSNSIPIRIQKWCRQRPLVAFLLTISSALVVALMISAVIYTGSLRSLQSQLENKNQDLNLRVNELAAAVQASNLSRTSEQRQRRIVERLLFAADVQHASRIWKKGDARETIRILSRYADAPKTEESIYGPDHFAWRFLWNHATNAFREIFDAEQSVWWMQPSPNGQHLTICGSDGKVQFLAINRGFEFEKTIKASSAEIGCVAYSDDSRYLATACDDGRVQLWDPESFKSIRNFEVIPGGRVYVVVFLPDSHQLLACGESTTLTLWDADSGTKIREISTPFQRPIEFMTLSPDRTQLLMAGTDGQIVQMRLEDYSILRQDGLSNLAFSMARYSADSSRIVCAGTDRVLRLVDSKTGRTLRSSRNQDTVHAVLYLPDGRIVIGDRGGVLTVFPNHEQSAAEPEEDWQPIQRWAGHDDKLSALLWLPNQTESEEKRGQLISADRSGIIRSWDVTRTIHHKVHQSTLDISHPVSNAISLTDVPNSVWRGGPNGLCVVSLDSAETNSVFLPDQEITAVQTSGGKVIAGNSTGVLTTFTLSDPESARSINVSEERAIWQVAIDRQGHYAVALDAEGQVAVIDLSIGKIDGQLTGRTAATISPNGKWVVSALAGSDNLEICSRGDLRPIAILPAHISTVNRIVFSPDGQYFISTSNDRLAKVWSAATWKLHHQLSGHQSYVQAAAVTADSQTLATGDEGGVIKLWDLVSGRELIELETIVPYLAGLTFSSDTQNLIVWDANLTTTMVMNPPIMAK